MKRQYITVILAAVFSMFMACEEYLDLQPSQSISEDLVLETDQNVRNVLLGAYSIFDNPELYGGNVLTFGELMGGDGEIFWAGTYTDIREMFNKQMGAANSDARAQWMSSYRVINIANNVLSALDVVNDANKGRVEGEALFLRALMHFDLVRFYALPYDAAQTNNTQAGVPIVLTPTRGINEDSKVSRETVEAVYGQIIADLSRAASILPATNTVFATSGAANALLARVYLQKGDYGNARDRANAVITSQNFELMPTYAAVFNNDGKSAEDIFVTLITTQDRFSAMTEFWSIPEFGGRDGDIDVLDAHLALYADNDQRKALFFVGNGQYRSGKWNNQYGVVNLIRLAEMYLIRAEANFRLGTSVGADPIADINTLRQRAGMGADFYEQLTLDNILLERRLELAHEGHKIHDVKRLKQNVGGRPFNANALVFPIPAREVEANPNLNQNPGYF